MAEDYGHIQAEIQKQLAIEISLQPIQNPRDTNENAAPSGEPADDQEYDFRLFSHADTTKKISLRNVKEISHEDSRLLVQRPLSYYIADPPDPGRQERLQYSALTGEEVLRRAQRPNWGMAMPWRVITTNSPAPVVRQKRVVSVPEPSWQEPRVTNKRPGKKSRIALRKRRAAEEERRRIREEKTALENKQKLEKEERLKEKKRRMNRLNKLRKKAKKQASNEGEDAASGTKISLDSSRDMD